MGKGKIFLSYFIIICLLFFLKSNLYSFLPVSPQGSGSANGKKKPPYEVKAGLIARFADFVEWPANSTLSDIDTPFTVGSFKKNETIAFFEKTNANRSIKGRSIKVLYISDYDAHEEIIKCNVLFIDKTSKKNLAKILAAIDNRPILTISDSRGYEKRGIILNIFLKEKRFVFTVNRWMAKKYDLTISSRLLKYASAVIEEEISNE